jgi:hypothetical protein
MNGLSQSVGPGLALLIVVFALIYAVLMFLAPFFWYGTNKRTRETSEKLSRIIELLEQQQRRDARNDRVATSKPTTLISNAK